MVGFPPVCEDGRSCVDVLQDHGLQHFLGPPATRALSHEDPPRLPGTNIISSTPVVLPVQALLPAYPTEYPGPTVPPHLPLVIFPFPCKKKGYFFLQSSCNSMMKHTKHRLVDLHCQARPPNLVIAMTGQHVHSNDVSENIL